jgi:hypothetical protein
MWYPGQTFYVYGDEILHAIWEEAQTEASDITFMVNGESVDFGTDYANLNV